MNTGTILLAEDEPALRGLIRRVLGAAGYEVIEARNGVEALDALRDRGEKGVDLIIADIHMPGMDGLSLVRRLRLQGCVAPLLVISARHLDTDLPTGSVFLSKPFTREDLVRAVRARIEAAGASQNCRVPIAC